MQSCESRITSSLLKTPPEELHIELEGKKLTQEDSFVYLGRALCGDEKTEKDVGLGLRWRAQAGANIQVLRNSDGGGGVSDFLEKSITNV